MKKIITLSLSVLLIFGLAACSRTRQRAAASADLDQTLNDLDQPLQNMDTNVTAP
jgi:hypothetical protein